eukprot:m.94700 g.94700  ORF g.94700 m.94700 type:complete len:90 (+) comp13457_c0_seq3:742-1011(+)
MVFTVNVSQTCPDQLQEQKYWMQKILDLHYGVSIIQNLGNFGDSTKCFLLQFLPAQVPREPNNSAVHLTALSCSLSNALKYLLAVDTHQ